MAISALAELGIETPIRRLSVQYRSMARLGDVVVPRVHGCEGGHTVELASSEGDVYAVVKFTSN